MVLKNKVLRGMLGGLIALPTLTGCTFSSMGVVEKSLEEDNFVPSDVVSGVDFLNEYSHNLRPPEQQLLAVDIALERQNVMATGDKIHMQVGLVTKPPERQAIQFHALVYNPGDMAMSEQQKLQATVDYLLSSQSNLPTGSTFSVDSLSDLQGIPGKNKALIENNKKEDLLRFLLQYARLSFDEGRHHFLLLLGNVSDLSYKEKQNIVDLAKIIRVKSASLSVLAVDDEPQIAFLQQLSKDGDGLFAMHTKEFDYGGWLKNEVYYVNAIKITDIQLTLNANYGASIQRILSPALYTDGTTFTHFIPELIQGHDYVILAEINTPSIDTSTYNEIVRVDVEYYDRSSRQYHKISRTDRVNFVMDRAEIINQKNHKVARSMLILDTQNVIQNLEPAIRDKRYYQAIAMLTEQSLALNEYGKDHNDSELLRDAEILSAYSDRLYEFDEQLLQSIKIWHDFSWDRSRFSERYW